MRASRSVMLPLVAVLAVWAAHFAIVYGATHGICERNQAATVLSLDLASVVIVASAIVAIAAEMAIIGWVMGPGRRQSLPKASQFVRWVAVAVGVLSIGAILMEALPAFVLPACR